MWTGGLVWFPGSLQLEGLQGAAWYANRQQKRMRTRLEQNWNRENQASGHEKQMNTKESEEYEGTY